MADESGSIERIESVDNSSSRTQSASQPSASTPKSTSETGESGKVERKQLDKQYKPQTQDQKQDRSDSVSLSRESRKDTKQKDNQEEKESDKKEKNLSSFASTWQGFIPDQKKPESTQQNTQADDKGIKPVQAQKSPTDSANVAKSSLKAAEKEKPSESQTGPGQKNETQVTGQPETKGQKSGSSSALSSPLSMQGKSEEYLGKGLKWAGEKLGELSKSLEEKSKGSSPLIQAPAGALSSLSDMAGGLFSMSGHLLQRSGELKQGKTEGIKKDAETLGGIAKGAYNNIDKLPQVAGNYLDKKLEDIGSSESGVFHAFKTATDIGSIVAPASKGGVLSKFGKAEKGAEGTIRKVGSEAEQLVKGGVSKEAKTIKEPGLKEGPPAGETPKISEKPVTEGKPAGKELPDAKEPDPKSGKGSIYNEKDLHSAAQSISKDITGRTTSPDFWKSKAEDVYSGVKDYLTKEKGVDGGKAEQIASKYKNQYGSPSGLESSAQQRFKDIYNAKIKENLTHGEAKNIAKKEAEELYKKDLARLEENTKPQSLKKELDGELQKPNGKEAAPEPPSQMDTEKLKKFVDRGFSNRDTFVNQHGMEKHVGMKAEQLDRRILEEGKSAATSFKNAEDYKKVIAAAKDQIKSKIETDPKFAKEAQDFFKAVERGEHATSLPNGELSAGPRLVITIDMPKGVQGYGRAADPTGKITDVKDLKKAVVVFESYKYPNNDIRPGVLSAYPE